jgi:glycosyltransferase involved in cell wall biosynthesis
MSDRNKILFLVRAFHPPWNEGTRVIARDLATIAGKLRDTRVISITQAQWAPPKKSGLDTVHILIDSDYGVWSDYRAIPQLMTAVDRIVCTNQYSITHLIGVPFALSPWLKSKGLKTVCHITLADQAYNSSLENLRHKLGWRLFDLWIDRYLLSSDALLDPLLRRGLPKEKLKVLPAPLDTSTYRPSLQVQSASLTLLSVLYIGSISPLRFPAELIQNAILQAQNEISQEIVLDVFAPRVTHPYNSTWQKSIIELFSREKELKFTIHQKDLSIEEKVCLYQNASIVLLPFQGPVAVEPPLTLIEAMSCGAIVAASAESNRSKIISDSKNGFLFSSADELADTIIEIAGQKESLLKIRQNARAVVDDKFGFDKISIQLRNIWRELEEYEK